MNVPRQVQIPPRSALPPFIKGGIEGGFKRVDSVVRHLLTGFKGGEEAYAFWFSRH